MLSLKPIPSLTWWGHPGHAFTAIFMYKMTRILCKDSAKMFSLCREDQDLPTFSLLPVFYSFWEQSCFAWNKGQHILAEDMRIVSATGTWVQSFHKALLLLQILADFHAAKGNWRGVAAAHLSFARRMQEEHYACSLLCNQLGMSTSKPRWKQSRCT